ncbi:Pentatricopeptide repeat-containing protein [Apostasia shenzhenica]|uniref:Pentatricopeptide repeat-containing protein n=1 Tax=Apostasia shenzhenica TaxID=1088818 RepID=A0A2I0A7T2_9ASPA|nr:Pentatricopeptide repeat-containing protein [Apostasia shenzhenica]
MPTRLLIRESLCSSPSSFVEPCTWMLRNPFLRHSSISLAAEPPLERYIGKEPAVSFLIHSVTELASLRRLQEAFAAFSHLRWRYPPAYILLRPISSLLNSAAAVRSLHPGLQLHALSLSLGFFYPRSYLILPPFTSFYLSLGLLSDAASVVNESTINVPWNLLISAYVRDGLFPEAFAAYNQMVAGGVAPDHFTFPPVLKACGETGDLGFGREIHRHIENTQNGWNLFVSNALVSMYLKCGVVDVARKLFDEMPERDVVSWNSIISGYASRGIWKEAFKLFERAKKGNSEVNSITWNTIISGALHVGDLIKALKFVSQMSFSRHGVDFVTLVIGLNACSRIGNLRLGKEIHGLAVRIELDGFENVLNALMTMYSRCKEIGSAYLLFRMIKNPSLITWNTMLAGLALDDRAEEASIFFRELMSKGLQPNYVTVVTILALCARVANLQHGRELHCYITKEGLFGFRLLWNSLIDMYSKSGRIMVARRVFESINDRDEVSYTSLIAGYGMQGEGVEAVKLFNEMINRGVKPDQITMVVILSACSHSGLVFEGELIFNQMEGSYGIKPLMEHFSCMVDMFARAGLLEKAEEMINKASLMATSAMWAALVGACQVYRNVEVGERAARRLLEMKTDNAGHYVLIANMYAAAGCWGELAKVRKMMRDVGVRKAPGCAWADLGNGFQPFLVGDRSSPLSAEIYEVLEGLAEQMSDAGYVICKELRFEDM